MNGFSRFFGAILFLVFSLVSKYSVMGNLICLVCSDIYYLYVVVQGFARLVWRGLVWVSFADCVLVFCYCDLFVLMARH